MGPFWIFRFGKDTRLDFSSEEEIWVGLGGVMRWGLGEGNIVTYRPDFIGMSVYRVNFIKIALLNHFANKFN